MLCGVLDVGGIALELELDEVACIDDVVEHDLDVRQFPLFAGLVDGDQRLEVECVEQTADGFDVVDLGLVLVGMR
ncbi:MAG TPA: hypothetical protein VM677_19440 [Actinokineospora sp.]|nr:hypothetical protein [Actinokineospora sp.]